MLDARAFGFHHNIMLVLRHATDSNVYCVVQNIPNDIIIVKMDDFVGIISCREEMISICCES